jgi:hypothetical protein
MFGLFGSKKKEEVKQVQVIDLAETSNRVRDYLNSFLIFLSSLEII